MSSPNSSPLRQRPVTRSDLRGRSALETTILAYCYGKVIAGVPVTIRDLATLPGPAGTAVGTGAALKAVRDLTDEGLLFLPGLNEAGLDQALRVLAPGRRPELVTTNTGEKVVARKPPPPWTTGEKVFGLWVPKNLDPVLADELRRAHLELHAFNKQHHGKAWPLEELAQRTGRKARALRTWADQHPSNRTVAEATTAAERAYRDICRQRDDQRAKTSAA